MKLCGSRTGQRFEIVVGGTDGTHVIAVHRQAEVQRLVEPTPESAGPASAGEPPTMAEPALTPRQWQVLEAYTAPLRAGTTTPATHAQVAEAVHWGYSLVRLECHAIWAAFRLAGVPMRPFPDTRDAVVDAARALVTAIGSHLGVLASELDKLASFAAGRDRITLEDVRAVGGYVPSVDRWAWFDLVGERRFEEAIRQLPELLESGESAVGLVAGIGSHLLRVAVAVAGGRDALEKQLPPNQRWLARRVGAAASEWTVPALDAALSDLLRTDRLLKSAPTTDRGAMEELLLRLATAREADRSAA